LNTFKQVKEGLKNIFRRKKKDDKKKKADAAEQTEDRSQESTAAPAETTTEAATKPAESEPGMLIHEGPAAHCAIED
jgi:hypothetical protein